MAELKEVKLGSLRANPFREVEKYALDEKKLEMLAASINTTGFWPNVVARKAKDGYEIAYGHHRHAAGLRVLGPDAKVAICVEALDDKTMLQMMVDENAIEYGHDFLTVMNSIAAVVKAYALGVIVLERPEVTAHKTDIRYAPRFSREQDLLGGDHPYTTTSVARYLGWMKTKSAGVEQPTDRVKIAINALELVEMGVCKPNAFQGLGQAESGVVVQQAQLVYKARMRELDKQAEEKEVRKAQAEAKKAATLSVTKNVNAIKDKGVGTREIREETEGMRVGVIPVPTQKKVDPLTVDISRMLERASGEVEDLTTKIDIFRERQANLIKTYAAGAICDKAVERKLEVNLRKFMHAGTELGEAFRKAWQKREG